MSSVRKSWDDFDPRIPIGYYWDRADLAPLNPQHENDSFPIYVIPITKRTLKLYVKLSDSVRDLRNRIREQLRADGQYVPEFNDFTLSPQIPLGNTICLDDTKTLGDYAFFSNFEFWCTLIIEYFTHPPNPIPEHLREKLKGPSPADTRYGGAFDAN